MNKRLAYRDACAQLGISGKNVYADSNDEEKEKLVEVDASLELQADEEQDTAVDDKEGVEVFVEGESDGLDDDEEPADRKSDDEQDDYWVVTPSGISYITTNASTKTSK